MTEVLDLTESATARETDATDELPHAAYATLTSTYAVAAASAVALAWRRGKLPGSVRWSDFALMAVATHKTARMLAHDSVTSFVRAPFAELEKPIGQGEVVEKVKAKRGIKRALGDLLTCEYCLGQWVGTTFVMGSLFAPRVTRLASQVMTTVFVSDTMQMGYTAAQTALRSYQEREA